MVDFWRLPLEGVSDIDEELASPAELISSNDSQEKTRRVEDDGQESSTLAGYHPPARMPRDVTGQPVNAGPSGDSYAPTAAARGLVTESFPWKHSVSSFQVPVEMEHAFGLQVPSGKQAGCPVQLASLGTYLSQLRPVDDGTLQESTCLATVPDAALPWIAGVQIARDCGWPLVPKELFLPPAGVEGYCLDVVGPSSASRKSSSWRSLIGGSLEPPDPMVCGQVGPVPPLPNPLTVYTDLPSLVATMLESLPEEDWDNRRFLAPQRIGQFENLCRGPGGILPKHAPRQLAQNAIAAAILNRLCGNLLIIAARCSKASSAAVRRPAEELRLDAAEKALKDATRSLFEARQDESEAQAKLREFQRSHDTDMDKGRELEGLVGWKSSLLKRMEEEHQEARGEVAAAKEQAEVGRGQQRPIPWHCKWSKVVPPEAADEELFGVRLTAKSPTLYTVSDFTDALQAGFIDRTGGGIVAKQRVEVAFVSHTVDELLLCTRSGDQPELAQNYTHLPAPVTMNVGLVSGDWSGGVRAPRPHHALLVQSQEGRFPFFVSFGAFAAAGQASGFAGIGLHVQTFSTPWNEMQYGDVLWVHEANDCLRLVPAVAALSGLVVDPWLPFGPFPAVVPEPQREVPLGCVATALLQAALFNNVKMWPVALPNAARVRWEYGLRVLRHTLAQHQDDDPIMPAIDYDTVRDETLPKCLEALNKVPDDDTLTDGGCSGFGDRLKRMELSEIDATPMQSAKRLKQLLGELAVMWPEFLQDTTS